MKTLSWDQADLSELKSIEGICLDIDDTLSTHGKLTSAAYDSLWRLKDAGFLVVPITGRPAGWCDHIARFWPVDAVVVENGAFSFFMEKGIRKMLPTPGADPDAKVKLGLLGEKIRKRFPHAKWASDQAYRDNDLAIDFCEDVPAWKEEDVDALVALCHAEGAHAKISSIHVNTWYGDFDKKKGFQAWIDAGAPGLGRTPPAKDRWLFIGDSPNDEPMFGYFDHSVGVANLSKYLARLKSPPKWMTKSESGKGFVEMADRMIASR